MKSLILTLALVWPLLGQAVMEGNEGGHGGDPYAIEFATIAQGLGAKLAKEEARDSALFQKWHFTAANFAQTAKRVRITSDEGESMMLRGQEVDAINFPDKNLIKVNRARWREHNLVARTKLVLHEVFGIMGVERDQFDASADFTTFTVTAAKELQRENPEGAFAYNLFYGRCLSFPSLSDPSTCEADSEKVTRAASCALTQAQGKCRLSGKGQCELMNTTYTSRMSTTALGVRYCEVLVLMK